jgi:hypothetical protein
METIKKYKAQGLKIVKGHDGLFEVRTTQGRLVSLFEDYLLAVRCVVKFRQ